MGCNKLGAFAVTRLNVGASNDLQMERNLTGGLPLVCQGHSTNVDPFRERFSPPSQNEIRGVQRVHVGVSDCETDNGENDRMHETNTNANEMHMML